MSLALQFHNIIEKTNLLKQPTKTIHDYLKTHPSLFKVILVANHIFRAATMVFFMAGLPGTIATNTAICFAASLLYRLTVETNCAYKFALPAFGGSVALPFAQIGLADFVSGIAFSSFKAFAAASNLFIPLGAYFTYIALTVSYDVDKNCPTIDVIAKSCCQS